MKLCILMTPNLLKTVMCNMENFMVPRPPALPVIAPPAQNIGQPLSTKNSSKNSKSQISRKGNTNSKVGNSSQGFRLVDHNGQNNDETGSVYSIYKQKIDSMFESDSSSTQNSVQAKIEKMFYDVAKDNGIPLNDIGVHSFSVDYLGSVSLQEKVTSLAGLQNPLKELYFAYKKIIRTKKVLTGRLEISSHGLKVQYQGEKGDLEQLNSFPTIAVWSAVKFVIHDKPKSTYAFLPLITDPDNMDKKALFRSLDENEKKYITSEAHSPLFAVVMRKIGVQKQLECHGFVCQTSEDAIVIAATLYKSLVAHMRAKERKPRNTNGVTTCMSITSSLPKDKQGNATPIRPPRKKRSSTSSSVISENEAISISDTKPLLDSSNKPPKKSTKLRKAPKVPEPKNEDLDAILPYEEPIKLLEIDKKNIENNDNQQCVGEPEDETTEIKPKTFTDKLNTYMSREQKELTAEIKQVMSEGGSKCLKNMQSVRKKNDTIRKKEHSGDILTKVTIPRSGSFLNAGGLTKYKNKASRLNDQGTGGSPLGFKEIFNELSLQEGLHSLDDILSVIIDPDGMSFNDLKPIYKEFLLKLSVTLTKDELYQKSKSIMRRQKKKLLRRHSSINTKKSHHILVGGKFRRLKHIFQKNIKLRFGKKSKPAPIIENVEIPLQTDTKLLESSISSSSYDTRHFRPKEEQSASKKQNYRKRSGEINKHKRDRNSTSEESDFFSLRKSKTLQQAFTLLHNQNRNSSSGYVSCSECSYDSDTCTCTSADKCYCSLGQKTFLKRGPCPNSTCKPDEACCCSRDNIVTLCDCDTDSCTESNKCYCPTLTKDPTNTEKLQQRGFLHSEEHHRHQKLCKKNSNTKSTKSLEYILNPHETYYEKLRGKGKFGTQNCIPILDRDNVNMGYELFALANGHLIDLQNRHNRDIYPRGVGKSNADLEGSGQVTVDCYGSSRNQHLSGRTVKSTAISSGECTEALSVKKSAEIAALFSDMKLSQTTDITHLAPKNFDLASMMSSRNSYNKLIYSQPKYTRPTKSSNKDADVQYGHHENNPSQLHSNRNGTGFVRSGTNSVRSRTNSASSVSNPSRNGTNQVRAGKNNMYSAKNGLYTIQSQSDESRRSSLSEGRQISENRDYFDIEPQTEARSNLKNVSSNMENSLGYLP